MTLPINYSRNDGWPTYEMQTNSIEYDWWSGLWEFTDEAVVEHGSGVFIEWVHAFVVPKCP